jgi:hypothetical protein
LISVYVKAVHILLQPDCESVNKSVQKFDFRIAFKADILTNKEIYAVVKKPTITETVRLHRLRWFGHVQRMEENRIPKSIMYESGNNKI